MAWPIIFAFPPPASLFITTMTAMSSAFVSAGISEMRGKNMPYSKFSKNGNSSDQSDFEKPKKIDVSGKRGMQIAYAPAFLAGLTSFVFLSHHDDIRSLLLSSALTIHFLKRLLEVQFVHKYSGGMAVDTAIPISLSYFMSTATMIYAQHLTITQGLQQPPIDLKYIGLVLFVLGMSGNFYHHYLLSRMRSASSSSNSESDDDKDYKIPRGGLFEFVVCPHYLFEIIVFIGFAFVSQTMYAFVYMVGTTFYLTGRSFATRRWYISKFKQFPQHVKALIPFLL